MNYKLVKHIESNIFPKYEKYYSHGMIHINNVIENALMLADYYEVDKDMCYTIAAYHDLGLNVDRDTHEIESGKILFNDLNLQKIFTSEQIKTMKEAIEDHRGSRKETPRNLYGKILSDSDRDFDIKTLAKRQLATSIKNYPELQDFDEHFERCYSYITKRLDSSGHFNLWTNNPILVEKRIKFEKEFLDKSYAKSVYKKEFDTISQNGTIDKIKNYYQDY